MTGRPTLLTPELQAAIVADVELGNYAETAAAAHGIDRATFYRWMQRGKDGEPLYRDFCDAITRARGHAEKHALKTVRDAFSDPKTGAENARWYLERTAPARFGRRDHVVVESKVREELDGALGKLESQLDPETYQRVLTALATGDARGAETGEGEGSGSGADGA